MIFLEGVALASLRLVLDYTGYKFHNTGTDPI